MTKPKANAFSSQGDCSWEGFVVSQGACISFQKQKNPQDNGPGDMELTAGIEPATSTLPM